MTEKTPVDSQVAARAAQTETYVRVLVVDDDPDARDLLHYVLPVQFSRHAEFVSADSLAQAYKKLSYHEIDVILLDLGLPDGEGLQTMVRMKAHLDAQGLDIPVIVLTGMDEAHLGRELIRAGAEQYLVKGKIDPRQIYENCANVALRRQQSIRVWKDDAEVVVGAQTASAALRQVSDSIPPASREIEQARDEVSARTLDLTTLAYAQQLKDAQTLGQVLARLDHLEGRVEDGEERHSQVELKREDVKLAKAEMAHERWMKWLTMVGKAGAKVAAVVAAAVASGGFAWWAAEKIFQ